MSGGENAKQTDSLQGSDSGHSIYMIKRLAPSLEAKKFQSHEKTDRFRRISAKYYSTLVHLSTISITCNETRTGNPTEMTPVESRNLRQQTLVFCDKISLTRVSREAITSIFLSSCTLQFHQRCTFTPSLPPSPARREKREKKASTRKTAVF